MMIRLYLGEGGWNRGNQVFDHELWMTLTSLEPESLNQEIRAETDRMIIRYEGQMNIEEISRVLAIKGSTDLSGIQFIW